MMGKKVRITIFHRGFIFIYFGGRERIVLEEVRGLKRRGYEVKVYAPTVDAARCYFKFLKEAEAKAVVPIFLINCLIRTL